MEPRTGGSSAEEQRKELTAERAVFKQRPSVDSASPNSWVLRMIVSVFHR